MDMSLIKEMFGEFSKKAIPFLVLALLIFLLLFIFKKVVTSVFASIKKSFSSLFESEEETQQREETEKALDDKASEGKKLRKLSDSEALLIANQLYEALLAGFTEDEDTVFDELSKIPTKADYFNVVAKFGVKKSSVIGGDKYTLSQAIREFMHGDDLEKVKSILSKISVVL